MKRPTTINLDSETRAKLEAARELHRLGKAVPSLSDVANEAIERGLPSMLSDASAKKAG